MTDGVLDEKHDLRTTLLHQNCPWNSNLRSNLEYGHILHHKIINFVSKVELFEKNFNFSNLFEHDAHVCSGSVSNIKLPENCGLSDEVCLNTG